MSNQSAARRFEYALVDVFAENPLEGNMLAIFTDARGLSDDEMQALARETNLAETTFMLPADDPADEVANGVHVRIFTTQEELPFAGHPTLGTASWLYQQHSHLRGAEQITLRLKGGPVSVAFRQQEHNRPGVFGTMRQHDAIFGPVHAMEEVSRASGIPIADLDSSLPIQTVSTGLPFCIVPLRSLEAISRIVLPQSQALSFLERAAAKFFYFIAPVSDGSDVRYRARMQFYNGEDPATGSAAGCAIAYLVQKGRVSAGLEIILEQGIEVRRPSRIYGSAALTDGNVGPVFVSGRTIFVATGVFSLPLTGRFPQPIVTEQQQ